MKTFLWNSKKFGKFEIKVDDEDAHWLETNSWTVSLKYSGFYGKVFYVVFSNSAKNKELRNKTLHRLITNCPKGMVVDHINHNTLDNTRENLRVCSVGENNMNRRYSARSDTGSLRNFRGVYKSYNCKSKQRWQAKIAKGNKTNIYLGTFDSQEAAAKAYDKKAKELFGEFAKLNFPEEKL